MKRTGLVLNLMLCLCIPLSDAAENQGGQIPDAIVAKVDPSVVAIKHEKSGGSGFIISEDGYILSNGHVVRGSDEEDPTQPAESITVILSDERKFPAQVIGFSTDPDVALLKIEVEAPLQPVEFADSTQAQIGQPCFAVGTPLGLKRTFTSGILSSVDRATFGTFTTVLQTDAAINPGNSGGALFDQEGRVLGVNTYSSHGYNNLGFTIPIHVALVLKDHFLEHGRFVRSDLPVLNLDELYDELALAFGVQQGVLISYVMPGSYVWEAGLRDGDLLAAIDGQPVRARTHAQLLDLIWQLTTRPPGDPIELLILRGAPDQTRRRIIRTHLVESEPLPQVGWQAGELQEHRYQFLGFGYQQLTQIQRLLRRCTDAEGVLITHIAKVGPIKKGDLKENDIITHVDGVATPDVITFQTELETHLAAQEKAIELQLVRRKVNKPVALAPYYDLKGLTVALVSPDEGSEHLPLLRRELIADGADVQMVTPTGGEVPLGEGRTVQADAALDAVDAAEVDILLLTGDAEDQTFWTDEAVLELAQAVHEQEGMLAGVGSASLALVVAVPELSDTKMTLPKEFSAVAIEKGAHYTGAEVETDGLLVTTTGFDRKTVRSFLNAFRRMARNQK
jgi:S1-C subfamily serine protease/putative intracellular protease/amidase